MTVVLNMANPQRMVQSGAVTLVCEEAHDMSKRTNAQWLADLAANNSSRQSEALEVLRKVLYRGIWDYLDRERSDLLSKSHGELEQMAEDFAQEATLRVLKNLDSFRGDSRFTTWAAKVAVRVAISELRRARYKDFSLDEIAIDGEFLPGLKLDSGAYSQAGPEKSAERMDVAEKIEEALATALTDRQRTVMKAAGIKGVPLEIVAEQMQTNRNALYKLLHDARAKLRNTLEQQGLSMDYIKGLFE